MTIMEMLRQSGVLTLLGVGTVFGFLIIMIISVMLMGKIVQGLGLDKSGQAPAAKDSSARGAAANHGGTVAAITAAVNEYRKNEESK